jgi:membrane dipeptidase
MDVKSVFTKKTDVAEEKEIRQERAEEIHAESIVIDGHQGTLFDIARGIRKFDEESSVGHSDLPRLRQGGVDCAVFTAFPYDRIWPTRGVKQGLEYIDLFEEVVKTPGVRKVLTTSDIEEANKQGEVGIMLSFGGGEFIESSVETLRMYYRLGLRMLTLTWDERNLLADGAAFSASRGGLTPLGVKVLEEAGRLGVLIDVSHLSEAGFWDVVDLAEVPFVASHSNCHALFAHPRNLTDGQLAAIGQAGGLVGISLNPEYLTGSEEPPTLSQVVDHIMHAVEIAGEEHVGIGTDFDSFSGSGPEPLVHIGQLPLLTYELLERGLSGRVISGILGGNWFRVLRAVIG